MPPSLVEAFAETRRALEFLADVPYAHRLRFRREALERAAMAREADPQFLQNLTTLVSALRDEALALYEHRRVVLASLGEFMD
jgi:hypothetical protein